jgi:hypothetical protein
MVTVNNLLGRVQKLDIDQIVYQTLDQAKEFSADLQVEQQLKGISADGSFMPDYSPVSVEVYGKPEGPIRLRETGAFQSAAYVRVNSDTRTFYSTDNKAEMLEKRYKKKGKDIFGLSDKFKQEDIRHIEPILIQNTKKAIQL